MKSLHKAIFIDRDGTLNRMVYDETHGVLDSPRRANQVRICEGAGHFIKGARALGYMVVVVTNQPGIAKGTMTVKDLEEVNARLREQLQEDGEEWDALYYCPHHPEGGPGSVREYVQDCKCRKPKPGMLLQAAKEHAIDLAASWMVGDGLNDMEAGRSAGCRSVLVGKLKMEQVERFFELETCMPDAFAGSLAEALVMIQTDSV